MRVLRRMLGQTTAGRPPIAALPPAPPPIGPAERAELEAAKARVAPKWAAFDALLADFRAGDGRLRITRQ